MYQTEVDTGSLASLAPDEKPHVPTRPVGGGVVTAKLSKPTLLTLDEYDSLFPIPQRSALELAEIDKLSRPVPPPSRPRNPDTIPRFNHLCQVHSLTSSFTFAEVARGLFSSKVEFGNYTYEEAGPFVNKKLAKEAVAERALVELETIESPLKDGKAKSAKRTPSDHDGETTSSEEAKEDWITILNMFAQKQRHTTPDFQFVNHNTRLEQVLGRSESPVQFSCTLSLQARPQYLFGSATTLHPSKAEAKRLAAKDAVIWLRTVGMLAESMPISSSPSPERRDSSTSETQTEATSVAIRLNTDQSPGQLVVALSLRLGLSQPRFECKPAGHYFYTCTAHYLDKDAQREPRLQGPLCATSAVHGQKNAKAMCCQSLLAILERMVAER